MPSNMSVVTAQTGGGSGFVIREATIDDPDSDFVNDETNVHVYDRAMEALGTVNMILCLMDQTRASDMVNAGDYVALVNEDKCDQGDNEGSSVESQSSGATEFNAWTISSTRADNESPQIVRLWIPGEEPDPNDPEDLLDAQTILVEVTVDQGVSDTMPFGSFEMNFKGVIDGDAVGGSTGEEVETMRGMLRTVANGTSQPQFEFVNGGGSIVMGDVVPFGFEEAANVVLEDADGVSGSALTFQRQRYDEPGAGTQERAGKFAIGFDATHLLRGFDENGDDTADQEVCLARDEFHTQVWRYNLYHRDDGAFNGDQVLGGSRVELDSGFPFTYDADGDGVDDARGWVGYHGVWSEHGTSLSDGTAITQFDYATDQTMQHQVAVSPGKLTRREANEAPLTSFAGDEFEWWGEHPVLGVAGNWVVTVDDFGAFIIIAGFEWGEDGYERFTAIDEDGVADTPPVEVAADLPMQDGHDFWMWSSSLGGSVAYHHDMSVPLGDRSVVFWTNETVSPGDDMFANGAVTVYCYDNCLKGGLTQTDVDAAQSVWDLYHTYAGTPFEYTIEAEGGRVALVDSAGLVVSAQGLDMSALGNEWGISTDSLVLDRLADANQPWLAHEQAVSFRWETGPNNWNRLVAVTSSTGELMEFDRPLRFIYTHSTANDRNGDATHDGKQFVLEYNGPGDLHGFPWVEDEENGRWHSAVTLTDRTELSDGDNAFVVKGIEMEQTMQTVDVSECSALDVAAVYGDAALALPSMSEVGTVSITLADKPEVDDAPAVIEGEIQD